MYKCIYAYMYKCINVYMYICINVYMYICIYVYMYICINVCMYKCIYVYMYKCIYCICVYVYMCICVYMYICIYVCFSDFCASKRSRQPLLFCKQRDASCLCVKCLQHFHLKNIFSLQTEYSNASAFQTNARERC